MNLDDLTPEDREACERYVAEQEILYDKIARLPRWLRGSYERVCLNDLSWYGFDFRTIYRSIREYKKRGNPVGLRVIWSFICINLRLTWKMGFGRRLVFTPAIAKGKRIQFVLAG